MFTNPSRRFSFKKVMSFLGYLTGVVVVSFGFVYGFRFLGEKVPFLEEQERIGLVGSVQTLNPLFVTPYSAEQAFSSLLFTGLTAYDDNNLITSALGTSWDVREGGREFLFHIDEEATWSDGQPVSSEDVVFSYSVTQDDQYHGWGKDFFRDVEMEIIDPKTVLFRLPAAYMPFLDTVTFPIVPAHAFTSSKIEDVHKQLFLRPNGIFGGQYELIHASTVSLPAQRNYVSFTFKHKTSRQELHLSVFPTRESLRQALVVGEVDRVLERNALDISEEYAQQGFQVVYTPVWSEYQTLLLNTNVIDESELRQAFQMAIEKTDLPGVPAEGPLPKRSAFWHPLEDKRITTDLEEAEKRLADKEYTISYVSSPEIAGTLEVLKQQLGSVGVAVNVRSIDAQELYETIIPERDFDLLLLPLQVGRDPDLYSFWHSSQADAPGLNVTGLRDRRIDKALENGRADTELETRKRVYGEFQEYFLEEQPAVFLYHPKIYVISRKDDEVRLSENVWGLEDLWR